MINSHKELIEQVGIFISKMPLIRSYQYIKDVDMLSQEVENYDARIFVIGLEGISFDDENYNMILSYRFVLADETIYNNESVVNSETENIFCISAFSDFLKYINDTPIEFNGLSASTENMGDRVYTTISGGFNFIVKRNPSYWSNLD